MRSSQALRREDPSGFEADLAHYWREGYAVVRGFFSPDEVEEIAGAMDQLHAEGVAHGRCFRHGNLFYKVAREADGSEPLVRMVQWPSYHQPVLNAVRLDPRFADLLEPLIGATSSRSSTRSTGRRRARWAISPGTRKPLPPAARSATAISARPTSRPALRSIRIPPESGWMRFIPRSHMHGDLESTARTRRWAHAMTDDALGEVGLSAADAVDLLLEPGDLALWSPYLVHGSGTNTSDHKRRLYINGYVRAEDCDRGEWAFRDGSRCRSAEPALVHYEALRERASRIISMGVNESFWRMSLRSGAVRGGAAGAACAGARLQLLGVPDDGFLHVMVPHEGSSWSRDATH